MTSLSLNASSSLKLLQQQQHHTDELSTSLDAAQTITELQIDLQQTIALANEMKDENAQLKKQLNDANSFTKANLQRHVEWKEAWKKERECLAHRETQLEQDEAKWKIKLEEGRRELKELERKKVLDSSSNDSDSGGIKNLWKDIQVEHDSKMTRLTEEVSKWRGQFYDCRKKIEGIQAKHDECQAQISREKDIANSIQKELTTLQQSFAKHIEQDTANTNSSASSEAIVLQLKIQLEEKEFLLHKLNQEVKDMQCARNDAVCVKDELLVSHQAELGNTAHEIAKYKAKINTIERQIQAAKKETTHAISSKIGLEESLNKANKMLEQLQETLTNKEESFKQRIDQLTTERAQSKSGYKKQLDSTNILLSEEQTKSKELERQCLATQEHAMQQIASLAKDLKPKDDSKEMLLVVAQDQIIRLDNTIANLQMEKNNSLLNHKAEVQRLEHAIESCHKDLNLCLIDKAAAEKCNAVERTKAIQFQKDLGLVNESLQKVNNKYQLLVDEQIKLSQQINTLSEENASMENKAMCKLAKATSEQKKIVQQLEKEKRRSNAYKNKAVEAHKRGVKAKELLDDICCNASTANMLSNK